MPECQGVCYSCRNKEMCVCKGKYNLGTCTKKATVFHEMNKGTKFGYKLNLCSNCSSRDLYALDNAIDSMGLAKKL